MPCDSKDELTTITNMKHILGNSQIKELFSDGFTSFKNAAKALLAPHHLSTPGIHKSNGIIERCNQDVLDGSRVSCCTGGLPGCFWSYASPCYTHLENITEDPDTENCAWNLRFNEWFKGLAIPFGFGIFFLPAPTKYTNRKSCPK